MADRSVFARRDGNSLPEGTDGVRGRREVREGLDIGEAEANEIRQMQRAQASDVAERVAANVAVIGGVGKSADANAIEDDPDDTREWNFAGSWQENLPHDSAKQGKSERSSKARRENIPRGCRRF
jgi:hypothetical protein